MSERYSVVISGAGPVGLLMANLLGSRGIKTLLIERRKSMYTYARAVGIDDEALRALQTIGLAEKFLKQVQYNPTIEYLSKNGYTFFSPSSDIIPYGYPILTTFFQPDLEKLLREGVKRFSSITFLENCMLEKFEDGGEQVSIKAIHEGETKQFKSYYLLACDGGRSTIRKHLGLGLTEDSKSQKWLVVDAKETQELAVRLQKYHDTYSNRPMVTISLPNGLRRFEGKINVQEHFPDDPNAEIINELFRPFIGDLHLKIIRSKIYDRYYRYAQTMQKGNVFLLGDAAHLLPPYGGQGLCSGMRDALNLSWKIADVVTSKMHRSLLKSYEQERKFHMEETVKFVKKVARKVEDFEGSEASNTSLAETERVTTTVAYQKMKPIPKFIDGLFLKTVHAGIMMKQPQVYYQNSSILFDDLLTFNYTLIAWESNIDLYLTDDNKQFWQQLRTQKIRLHDKKGILTHSMSKYNDNCILAIYEDWKAYLPTKSHVIILRPDRFIFGVCTLDTLNKTTHVFKDMCGAFNFNNINEL